MAAITIRTATVEDVDAIVRVAIDVIPQEPQVLYQYPYTEQFPEDCYRCTTEEIKGFMANASPVADIRVMVAEVEDASSPSGKTVIAYTVWDIMAVRLRNSVAGKSTSSEETKDAHDFDCSSRRDADWDRIKYYGSIINPIVWKYLEPTDRTAPPRTYIHLIRVATTPRWQRHGAGTLLVNWGLELAQQHQLRVGLLATPSGHGLYTQLGFKDVKTAFVRLPEEKESVSMQVMNWYPKATTLFAQGLGYVRNGLATVLGRICT